ncbi:nicotinate-nucleotide adenylyltransferase [Acidaminobacter hydrogenoformans]|uniref:Probable nicotinate-nucleotide adenylyltransferase n=1 Tax=Acidaminobacter hydrogenoformans DSM 2784 TaxID=1120920 RepID=A0A1G5RT77_9FIRM|nr:nicotinate-nucleotide adenylyltransferase [Acidaminobacter hydrogenoformans]SCZ77196.1 nicotinate-nucleotide adenylyltransferase [Acidaminobacter hydrogenoformans DSM 2784]
MKTEGKRIGLMGGSFDPIHYGHLVLAEEMRSKLSLDKVIFIPVGRAPHKRAEQMTKPRQRYDMVMLATLDHPNFEVSAIEIEREEVTYSFETVAHIAKNSAPGDEFYFIAGADALMELETWRSVEVLLKMVTFVGAARPGTDQQELIQKMEQLRQRYGASIKLVELPELDISSTDLRRRVRLGLSVKYLMPESVSLYIGKHKLYLKELSHERLSD